MVVHQVTPNPFDGALANVGYGLIGIGVILVLIGLATRRQHRINPRSGCIVFGIITTAIGSALIATIVGSDLRSEQTVLVVNGSIAFVAIVGIVAVTSGNHSPPRTHVR